MRKFRYGFGMRKLIDEDIQRRVAKKVWVAARKLARYRIGGQR